jgi:hypothetical protein
LFRPNAPRMITVLASIVLLIGGLALVFFQSQATDIVSGLPLGRDLSRQVLVLMTDKTTAWAALAASPILLILGSLLRGI